MLYRTIAWEFDCYTRLPLPNTGTDFEYTKANGLHACPTEWRMLKDIYLETMQEHVGGRMEKDAELIGHECMAGGSVGFKIELVLFDIELIFSTLTIPVLIQN